MGLKSIQVPQPEFSNWVIKKRQELNFSPSCFREKVGGKLSERTLKYIEDGKKNSFSEYTLNMLAKGLELGYPELLEVIDSLDSKSFKYGNSSNKTRSNKVLLAALSVFLILLVAAILLGRKWIASSINDSLFKSTNSSNDWQRVADVQIHADYPQIIIAFNGKGEPLWQQNLNTRVQKVAVSDLDGDGNVEVIAGTCKPNSKDQGERPGWLLVWNEKGDLITELNLWKPSIYPVQEPRANISDFKIIDLENDGTLEIVVAVRGEQYYPSRIAVLHFQDSKFEEVKRYWNPGYVIKLFIEAVDNDNLPEILCTCVNNDFKRVPEFGLDDNVYSLFMLKGTEIYGQAPPYLGEKQIGSEIWYRYVTPPSSHKDSEIVDITFMGEDEKLIYVKLKDMCFFYLNYSGEIVDTFKGDNCTGETQLHLVPRRRTWK